MKILMFVAVMLGSVEMNSINVKKHKRTLAEKCYGSLGCFSTNPPFTSPERPISFVPHSPDQIKTKFVLFTRTNRDVPQILDATNLQSAPRVWTHFKVRKTQILIHGFTDSYMKTPLWTDIKDELLTHGDYNVIIVDWSSGNLPPYTQATANTRVVGAQVADLVKTYTQLTNITRAEFHVIGHSLGAHTAGYAGERVKGLGRITGLDPAAPYFENTDPRVRLDETDANFVDVIHTDAKSLLLLGVGIKIQSGHADFFPNLGYDQPGCGASQLSLSTFLENGVEGLLETFSCNHVRAIRFFTESINSACPFLAIPCASEGDFVNNLRGTCAGVTCSYMGFHADKKPPPKNQPTKYFLTTGDRQPLCRYHYGVTIKFSLGQGSDQEGKISLNIKGDTSTLSKVSLNRNGNSMTFKAGQSYKFDVMLPSDVGNIQSVTFSWERASSFLDIIPFNIFNDRNSKMYVDTVDLYREEAGINATFCARGQSVVSGSSLTISRKC